MKYIDYRADPNCRDVPGEELVCVTWYDGDVVYYFRKNYHRLDGPAIIYYNGITRWFINGTMFTDDKSYQIAAGLSDEDMIAIILKYGSVK